MVNGPALENELKPKLNAAPLLWARDPRFRVARSSLRDVLEDALLGAEIPNSNPKTLYVSRICTYNRTLLEEGVWAEPF